MIAQPLRLLAPAILLAACQTLATADERPARIVGPDDASRAALARALAAELSTDVRIADDALTDSSELVIERAMPRGPDGTPLQGRVTEAPIRFRLVTDGAACILVDTRDGSRQPLEDTDCRPE